MEGFVQVQLTWKLSFERLGGTSFQVNIYACMQDCFKVYRINGVGGTGVLDFGDFIQWAASQLKETPIFSKLNKEDASLLCKASSKLN